MTTRSTKRTVTFSRPFKLGTSDAEFPPGRYFLEIDEDLVDDLSFPVYRRTATMMQLIADPLRPGITETALINLPELEAALEKDGAPVLEVWTATPCSASAAECIADTETKATNR